MEEEEEEGNLAYQAGPLLSSFLVHHWRRAFLFSLFFFFAQIGNPLPSSFFPDKKRKGGRGRHGGSNLSPHWLILKVPLTPPSLFSPCLQAGEGFAAESGFIFVIIFLIIAMIFFSNPGKSFFFLLKLRECSYSFPISCMQADQSFNKRNELT